MLDLFVPFSCCQWPAGARAAPWSGRFCADAEPLGYAGCPAPSNIVESLKVGTANSNCQMCLAQARKKACPEL